MVGRLKEIIPISYHISLLLYIYDLFCIPTTAAAATTNADTFCFGGNLIGPHCYALPPSLLEVDQVAGGVLHKSLCPGSGVVIRGI